jgi:hypothetical protein
MELEGLQASLTADADALSQQLTTFEARREEAIRELQVQHAPSTRQLVASSSNIPLPYYQCRAMTMARGAYQPHFVVAAACAGA